MSILNTPADIGPNPAVRLIGIGASGRRFVQQFHARIGAPPHTPLGDLLMQSPVFIETNVGDGEALAQQADLLDARILCMAFGYDMSPVEIEVAMCLIWRMWDRDSHVIGIVVGAGDHSPPQAESMLGILCDSLDARIDIVSATDDLELAPLQWFYVGLQRSVLEGLSIMEAAWDHSDVVETLDLGAPRLGLELFTQPLDAPTQLDAAMVEVLAELQHRGAWLEEALGAVLVLWAPSEYQLTVSVVRGLGRSLAAALGAGALHLTIRLQSRPVPKDQRAYMTLVVSTPRTYPHLLQ